MKPVSDWTDERLDDLNHRVSDGFNRIDADLRSIRDEIGSLRAEMKSEIGSLRAETTSEIGSLRAEMKSEIGSLRAETNARFDALQRTMLQLGGGMIATFVVGFAGLLATHA
jgi:hypothetical protein